MNTNLARPYRYCSKTKELNSYFKGKSPNDTCMIWQNIDKIRYVYYSDAFTYNIKYNSCVFSFKEIPQIDVSEPIYCRFKDGHMFKTRVLSSIGESIVLRAPQEFMAFEFRDNPRMKFKANEPEYAILNLSSDITKKSSQEMSFQLIDISQAGMCLNLSDSYLERLLDSKEVYLKKLFMVTLAKDIQCEMIYSKKIRYKVDGEIYTGNRVGIKFCQKLEDYLLKLI